MGRGGGGRNLATNYVNLAKFTEEGNCHSVFF